MEKVIKRRRWRLLPLMLKKPPLAGNVNEYQFQQRVLHGASPILAVTMETIMY